MQARHDTPVHYDRLVDELRKARSVTAELRLVLERALRAAHVPVDAAVSKAKRLVPRPDDPEDEASELEPACRRVLRQACLDDPTAVVARVVAADAPLLTLFFAASDSRIRAWFDHFSMQGPSAFQRGAKALASFSLAHRNDMWHLLVWAGRHGQAPIAVTKRMHYFCELDVVATVRNLVHFCPDFWRSEDLRETLGDGELVHMYADEFADAMLAVCLPRGRGGHRSVGDHSGAELPVADAAASRQAEEPTADVAFRVKGNRGAEMDADTLAMYQSVRVRAPSPPAVPAAEDDRGLGRVSPKPREQRAPSMDRDGEGAASVHPTHHVDEDVGSQEAAPRDSLEVRADDEELRRIFGVSRDRDRERGQKPRPPSKRRWEEEEWEEALPTRRMRATDLASLTPSTSAEGVTKLVVATVKRMGGRWLAEAAAPALPEERLVRFCSALLDSGPLRVRWGKGDYEALLLAVWAHHDGPQLPGKLRRPEYAHMAEILERCLAPGARVGERGEGFERLSSAARAAAAEAVRVLRSAWEESKRGGPQGLDLGSAGADDPLPSDDDERKRRGSLDSSSSSSHNSGVEGLKARLRMLRKGRPETR